MTRQIATFAVISISVIFGILLIFIDGLAGSKLEIAVAVSALATGATGIILGLSSLKQASFGAIREYYQQGDTKEMIENRKKFMVWKLRIQN